MPDADGIAALSMRKLGARLNAGATSLYRHVATKDELMEVAVDEVFGEAAVPAAGDGTGWRTVATEVQDPVALRGTKVGYGLDVVLDGLTLRLNSPAR